MTYVIFYPLLLEDDIVGMVEPGIGQGNIVIDEV